jgi:hypothetical protein
MTKEDIKNIEEIKSFLDENKIQYSTNYDNFCLWYGNPNGRRSYEIEYVPSLKYPVDYPKFNIKGVDKNYFYNLSKQAEDNNSFKMWIKDFEWKHKYKKEILKSQILYAADKIPYKFYARDCEVKEVKTKEARAFEVENCFYGKRGASLNLGLYLKKDKHGFPAGKLLMLYTFGKNFFGKNENLIEVLRVGTLVNCHVSGGSSKLLKHFIKNYKTIKIGKRDINVKQLKFYSDYDHNIGSSMDTLGFKLKEYSKGGFMNYWIETGEVKHRQPMKHKWVMEQMEKGKCLSVPNAGVKTYIMDIEENEKIK